MELARPIALSFAFAAVLFSSVTAHGAQDVGVRSYSMAETTSALYNLSLGKSDYTWPELVAVFGDRLVVENEGGFSIVVLSYQGNVQETIPWVKVGSTLEPPSRYNVPDSSSAIVGASAAGVWFKGDAEYLLINSYGQKVSSATSRPSTLGEIKNDKLVFDDVVMQSPSGLQYWQRNGSQLFAYLGNLVVVKFDLVPTTDKFGNKTVVNAVEIARYRIPSSEKREYVDDQGEYAVEILRQPSPPRFSASGDIFYGLVERDTFSIHRIIF